MNSLGAPLYWLFVWIAWIDRLLVEVPWHWGVFQNDWGLCPWLLGPVLDSRHTLTKWSFSSALWACVTICWAVGMWPSDVTTPVICVWFMFEFHFTVSFWTWFLRLSNVQVPQFLWRYRLLICWYFLQDSIVLVSAITSDITFGVPFDLRWVFSSSVTVRIVVSWRPKTNLSLHIISVKTSYSHKLPACLILTSQSWIVSLWFWEAYQNLTGWHHWF